MPPRPDPYLSPAEAPAPRARREAGAERPENKLALLALASALASFVCLPAIGGLLAMGLGMAARSEIKRRALRQGSGMALAAILLGGVNLLVSAVAGAIALLWVSELHAPWQQEAPLPQARATPPITAPRPVAKPVETSTIGDIEIVDIRPHVRSLGAELERQQRTAAKEGKRALLWLVGPHCAPCDGVAKSLKDPSMQDALRNVRLIRLDAGPFQAELARLRVPTHAIPGFALLGSSGRPIDYIHGGEWDEDIAANIAPVLGKFVRGAYTDRRYPWRGGVREDETAL